MKFPVLVIAFFVTGMLFAQQKVLLKIPLTGNTIQSFIPKGYDTLATAKGDLNNDKVDDHVLVLKSQNEDSLVEAGVDMDSFPPRVLIVLFKTGAGFSRAGRSDSAVLCRSCGGVFGDPFAEIIIQKGVLSIYHYGGSNWRWELTHKFRYQQNDFYLIGTTNRSYFNGDMCEKLGEFVATKYKDVNLVTGSYEQKEVSEKGCKLLVNKKGKLKTSPLKKLTAFNIEN
jgi:hypothetical protein